MRYDKFSQVIFNTQEIFDIIYNNDLNKIQLLIAEDSQEIEKFNNHSEIKISKFIESDQEVEIYDQKNQQDWFMPEEYKDLDIEKLLVDLCPRQNYQRLIDELQEFRERNLLNLLKWLKYFVDTCRKENIVWGVGRGSSVSSYVLYLLGVHKIDSIKYNLDYKEFLR